jgi:hypothetical protein
MNPVCDECGVPKIVSKTHVWRDGCIVDKASGEANLCMYEVSFHNALVNEVEKILGIPLDNIIYNAGRNASERVITDMFAVHPLLGRLAFSAPFSPITQRILPHFGRALGVGSNKILKHKRKKYGILRMCDPYHLEHCLAVVAGAIQVMYKDLYEGGTDIAYEVTPEDDCYMVRFTLQPREESEEDEAQLRLGTADLTPSEQDGLELPQCPKCKVPREIGQLYQFDMDKGIITERLNVERTILIGLYSLNSIVREMERELGYNINDLFIKEEKDNFKRKLAVTLLAEEMRDEDELREYLALRGLGLLTEMEEDGGEFRFTIANVFIPPMVAGRLLALCEYKHEMRCSYEYTVEGNTLHLSISSES